MPKGIPSKKNVSPTVLTIRHFKKLGVPVHIVEKWVKTPQGGFRLDCFGFDILCLLKNSTLGVQAGAANHHKSKVDYALTHPKVRQWLESPVRSFHVWTFSQKVVYNKTGAKRKKLKWTPRVTEIYLQDGVMMSRPFLLAESEPEKDQ
jgi:hypothetical protein